MNIPIIDREKLNEFRFMNHEVLQHQHDIAMRKFFLEEAMILGNSEKHKVKIIFETTDGPLMVETTVWDTTDSHVELKGQIDIPICCIREVIL